MDIHRCFHDCPVAILQNLHQFSLRQAEYASFQVIQILQDEEYAFIRHRQRFPVTRCIGMDISVADLMIQIAKAELDEIQNILPIIFRNQL